MEQYADALLSGALQSNTKVKLRILPAGLPALRSVPTNKKISEPSLNTIDECVYLQFVPKGPFD
jgi:hypothetical protein